MTTVTEHPVLANVRTEGAIGIFQSKTFYLMLPAGTLQAKEREAIRILRQIGYETRGVKVEAP